jgi:hypothetical protein
MKEVDHGKIKFLGAGGLDELVKELQIATKPMLNNEASTNQPRSALLLLRLSH